MRLRQGLLLGSLLLLSAALCTGRPARAEDASGQIARIAEIEIDPAQIEPYRAALRRGIEAAHRLEPGVLALFAVSVKGHPEQVRVFELYASQAAYDAHLRTPHFRAYKAATEGMVRSLKLIETDPILITGRQLP